MMNAVPDPILEAAALEIESGLDSDFLLLLSRTTDVDKIRAIIRRGITQAMVKNTGRLRSLLLTDQPAFEKELRVRLPAGEIREHWQAPGG